MFSVKDKKPRWAMRFFQLNFPFAQGILAQKICNVHAIFHHFSEVKNGDDPNNQAISLSNAILFSMVFFVCVVQKLNYIKNDFV